MARGRLKRAAQLLRFSDNVLSDFATRTVSARRKFASALGQCRSNSVGSACGWALTKFLRAISFQYSIIALTKAIRAETSRDLFDSFIAVSSLKARRCGPLHFCSR